MHWSSEAFIRKVQPDNNNLMTHLGLETTDHLAAVRDLIWPLLTG